jgi:drug/metabolite transporter (DMT)-like permease
MRDLRSARPLRHVNRWGLTAGFAALVLWPVYAAVQEPVRPWYMAALALAAACGAVILLAALLDLATVRRARSVLPARVFDLCLGLLLVVPSGAALVELLA